MVFNIITLLFVILLSLELIKKAISSYYYYGTLEVLLAQELQWESKYHRIGLLGAWLNGITVKYVLHNKVGQIARVEG